MKKRMSHIERIRQSKASKWKNLDLLYEFEMDFIVEHINKVIDEYIQAHQLNEGDYLPSSLVIDAYEQQDLIIVLKEKLINKPEFWHIGIDSHFYNADTDQIYTIPFSVDLPAMSFAELMGGRDIKVSIVDGIKTIKGNWKGLQNEMLSNWERQGVPDGYDITQSQVKVIAQAHYVNQDCFDRFEKLAAYREQGVLIKFLKQLEGKGL